MLEVRILLKSAGRKTPRIRSHRLRRQFPLTDPAQTRGRLGYRLRPNQAMLVRRGDRVRRGQVIARVGSSEHVFNLKTLPPHETPAADPTSAIVDHSRRHFARSRRDVESRFQKPQPRLSQRKTDTKPSPPKSQTQPTPAPPAPEVTTDDLSDFVS